MVAILPVKVLQVQPISGKAVADTTLWASFIAEAALMVEQQDAVLTGRNKSSRQNFRSDLVSANTRLAKLSRSGKPDKAEPKQQKKQRLASGAGLSSDVTAEQKEEEEQNRELKRAFKSQDKDDS
jgi:hypothetical protein